MLLDPGFDLTLRPMKYPEFYEMYRDAIKNTWTVEEVDFSQDTDDLQNKLLPSERHMVNRLVAFFATGDSIVSNNLVLNLYKHLNSPEARMFLSRQLYEEALHVQFYLTLLDTYITDHDERHEAFVAIETIPSIQQKGEFCLKWIDGVKDIDVTGTDEKKRAFLLNLICFSSCIEGLFFFGAFAYVYFLRDKGLLPGLAMGTNWVFRDESCVREGTEILTSEGWRKFEALDGSEQVAQFSLSTGDISFVVPLRLVVKPFDGELVVFSNEKGGVHQAITPDHDVVQRWGYQSEWSKQKASEFKPKGKKCLPVAGQAITASDPLSPWQRFLIALQADGSLPSERYTGERCGTLPATFSLTRPRKIKRLRAILALCGFNYSISEANDRHARTIRVSVPTERTLTKTFSDWVQLGDVSAGWCAEFIEELAEWDGHRRKGTTGSIHYSSVVLENVETVQAIAALCGRHASLGQQVKLREDGTEYAPIYRTTIRRKDFVRAGKGLNRTTQPYKGNVYCVTVPEGAIVIRSEGKVSVTGNCHMNFAFKAIETIRAEVPHLFNDELEVQVRAMISEAVECEYQFAVDVLQHGVPGMSLSDMRTYLQHVGDQRLVTLGYEPEWGASNPFAFMELQGIQELTNFFERRVSAYQIGVTGEVSFDEDF